MEGKIISSSTMHSPSSCVMGLRPPISSYKPCLWGDEFTSFALDNEVQETYAKSIDELKKEARSLLMAATSCKLIELFDTLERLGLAYHLENEMEDKLKEIYEFHLSGDDHGLHTTALVFRLLRQHQYHISCDVFDKYMDKDGKFKETLTSDVEGLLSLYEAAHVQFNGEDILDEAVAFTTHHLTRMASELEPPLKDKVKRALAHPLHRGVPIIEIRHYISIYERDGGRDALLLKLAKLNFNFLQNLYKKDLSELSRWRKNFDLGTKLPYARDRIIECYFWGASIRHEPEYSCVRKAIAKGLYLCSIIDDTYDNYATLDEAQLFTDILERWDIDDVDQLPDYMRIVYRFVMSVCEDFERDAARQDKSFAVPYLRETIKQLGRAYNQELKWMMERQMPSFQEFMSNSMAPSCIYVSFTVAAPGLKSVTKETFDWLLSEPKIMISTAKTGRHLQNLASYERESKGGKMLTVVDCYMKQYGVSKQETLSKFAELVEDGWKNVNTERAQRTSDPKDMVELLLNYMRLAELTYKNFEDGYTYPETLLAPLVVALFVDPIAI